MKIALNGYHDNGGSRWWLITFFSSVYITTIVDKQHRVMVSCSVSYRIKTELNVCFCSNDTSWNGFRRRLYYGEDLSLLQCKGPDATCLCLELCCSSLLFILTIYLHQEYA